MYPYLPTIGPFHLLHLTLGPFQPGTFGLLLWLAAVVATVVLHRNLVRNGVNADALNIVALVIVIAGVIGAKTLRHELENMRELRFLAQHHPSSRLASSRSTRSRRLPHHWFRDRLRLVRRPHRRYRHPPCCKATTPASKAPAGRSFEEDPGPRPGPRVGAIRMLDLAAPAAAIGYGVGPHPALPAGRTAMATTASTPRCPGESTWLKMRWSRPSRPMRSSSLRLSTSSSSSLALLLAALAAARQTAPTRRWLDDRRLS